jgi:hypothetical protein
MSATWGRKRLQKLSIPKKRGSWLTVLGGRGRGDDRLEDVLRVPGEAGKLGMRSCSLGRIFLGRGKHIWRGSEG